MPEPVARRALVVSSPIGPLRLVAEGDELTGLHFGAQGGPAATPGASAVLDEAARQLAAWFDGRLQGFDLPLRLDGTEFQQRVWAQLRLIGYGEIISYKDQALRIGPDAGFRAVGAANGQNPIAIVVPCHRVVAHDGGLGGFGGGLARKRWLLDHEARHTPFRLV